MKKNTNIWWSIDAAVSKITKWALVVSFVSIVYMMITATIDIITTKLFSFPLPGTSEIIEELNIPLVYMGMAYVQLTRGHISGPVFEEKFSARTNKIIHLAGHVIGIAITALVSWGSLQLIEKMIRLNQIKEGMVDITLFPFAITMFVGFVLFFFAYIITIVRDIVGVRREEFDPTKELMI